MDDLSDTIIPKSDQLNADDLLTGPITVTVTAVRRGDKEQPVIVAIDGGRQPYKPCKGMRRLLIAAWGNDGAKWVGRKMTLYCDPDVKFGGVKVGGIRISHLSHIPNDMSLALTVTRGKRVLHTVAPLPAETQKGDIRISHLQQLLADGVRGKLKAAMAARNVTVKAKSDALTWIQGLSDDEFASVSQEVLGDEA